MHNGPYNIVVPTLALRSQQGGDGEATINFLPKPLELGGAFWIEFWLKPVAYPSDDGWAVLGAVFETEAGEKDELVLRLGAQQFGATFRWRLKPFSTIPLLGQWTHVALAYNRGEWTQVMFSGGKTDEVSQRFPTESFRLTELRLLAKRSAENWFAELQIWKEPRDRHKLEPDWRSRLPGSHDYETGLIGHWSLDEVSGRVLVDKCGGNHGVIEFGGEWQRDSGLAFTIGWVESSSEQRSVHANGQYVSYLPPPHWRDPPPPVDQQIKHLDVVIEQGNKQMQNLEEDRRRIEADPELETNEREAWGALIQEGEQLEALKVSCEESVRSEKEKIEQQKAKTLASIQSSQEIALEQFILKLEKNLARGRASIRRDYGRVYGMDRVSVDVKMVAGVGGVGLQLPKQEAGVDPNRLSTLKLRFRANKEEEEAEGELVTVPWLEGNTEEFARRKLGETGLRVDVVYQVVTEPSQHGRILEQIYEANEDRQAALDSVVTLVVGRFQ